MTVVKIKTEEQLNFEDILVSKKDTLNSLGKSIADSLQIEISSIDRIQDSKNNIMLVTQNLYFHHSY